MKVMGELVKSGQQCTVPGANIHFGSMNILATLSYVEERIIYAREAFGFSEEQAGGA